MKNEQKLALDGIIRSAGDMILSAHDKSEAYGITAKPGSANFVTEYDVAVQHFIIGEVKKLFPGCEFMAEEQENDPCVLSSGDCFILDPIDGTTNFIRDLKQSSISLAYLHEGVLSYALVYAPYTDEMFTAERGKGAFLNQKEIHISSRTLENGILAFGSSPYYKELADKTFTLCRRVFEHCADIRRGGSAAIDLANLAAGKTDLFFECRLSPWDYAAGLLLVEEAGGIITDMSGEPLSFLHPCSVIAANRENYPWLLETSASI